jgi:hypothetical protein
LCACGKDLAAPAQHQPAAEASGTTPAGPTAPAGAPAALPAHRVYPDLGHALVAIIPADARVIGLGELHARTDRAPVTSSLAHVTRALPALGDRVSDLVLETWLPPPACGAPAVQATARIEASVRRPEATRSEIAELIDAARAAGARPHAMTISCADHAAIAPPGGEVDPVQLLAITTRELARIATSAVAHRDREAGHRPWIAIYGGALHNDRFPDAGVAEWSYADAVDRASGGRFVEIDVIVPELAEADPRSRREPWFPLVRAPRDPRSPVAVWTRGERSFVVILPPS